MSNRRSGRRIWIAIAACTALIVLEFGASFRVAIDEPRNDSRLAPAAAMVRGVPLWSPDGEGPLLDMIYGPVAAWVGAEATLAGAGVIAFVATVGCLYIPGMRDTEREGTLSAARTAAPPI